MARRQPVAPAQIISRRRKQNQQASDQLHRRQRMVKDQIIDDYRHKRIDKGERTGYGRRQFLNRTVEQLVHNTGMHNAQNQQVAPGTRR